LDGRHLILAGHITGAHGLKGEVKLRSFTEDPLAIARYGPLEVEGSGEPVTILKLRPARGGLVATLAGVTDRSAAEAMRGRKLFVARANLPEPAPGTCYHADLIGLLVRTTEGLTLGRVVGIANFGAGDLLDVEVEGKPETLLVPLAGARVDLDGATIAVDLPEGYLDRE
jgi:16S rRNA processing protein RimM